MCWQRPQHQQPPHPPPRIAAAAAPPHAVPGTKPHAQAPLLLPLGGWHGRPALPVQMQAPAAAADPAKRVKHPMVTLHLRRESGCHMTLAPGHWPRPDPGRSPAHPWRLLGSKPTGLMTSGSAARQYSCLGCRPVHSSCAGQPQRQRRHSQPRSRRPWGHPARAAAAAAALGWVRRPWTRAVAAGGALPAGAAGQSGPPGPMRTLGAAARTLAQP